MTDTETENKSTGNELVDSSGGNNNCRLDKNNQISHEHANTATGVDRAGEPGQCGTCAIRRVTASQ